jgi:hypothetical protein
MMVMVAAFNLTMPHGWRPYHRPDCWQMNRQGTRAENWQLTSLAEPQADERRARSRTLQVKYVVCMQGKGYTPTK